MLKPLFVAAALAACSGPTNSEPVGPRPGESTAPLPADPSSPNPDAAGVPEPPPETTTPADLNEASVRRASPRVVAQVASDGGVPPTAPVRPGQPDGGVGSPSRDAGAPPLQPRPTPDAGRPGQTPDAGSRPGTPDAAR